MGYHRSTTHLPLFSNTSSFLCFALFNVLFTMLHGVFRIDLNAITGRKHIEPELKWEKQAGSLNCTIYFIS